MHQARWRLQARHFAVQVCCFLLPFNYALLLGSCILRETGDGLPSLVQLALQHLHVLSMRSCLLLQLSKLLCMPVSCVRFSPFTHSLLARRLLPQP